MGSNLELSKVFCELLCLVFLSFKHLLGLCSPPITLGLPFSNHISQAVSLLTCAS